MERLYPLWEGERYRHAVGEYLCGEKQLIHRSFIFTDMDFVLFLE